MRRREILGGLAALTICVGGFDTHAQVLGKPFLIAWLSAVGEASNERTRSAFFARLQELGYVEGRDYRVEARYADGIFTRLPMLAEELVRLKPNVIVAASTLALMAAQRASSEIPLVAPSLADPVSLGLIASQARPGGNVTGILVSLEELTGKQLALGRELVPGASKFGLLVNSRLPTAGFQRRGADVAAAALSIELVPAEVQSPADLESAFEGMARAGVGLVLVLGDAMFLSERRRVAGAALSTRLPTMFIFREHVEDGGLMSYGVDLRESSRHAASFVDRILKGAKPADLPVELPTTFELVINLKTAKAIGLTIPDSLLGRADEVIE
jgi:putative tryptophan/tyrosine transport system substrate-binding protein